MPHLPRQFRIFAIVLLTCSVPAVCPAAVELGVELCDVCDVAAIWAVRPGSLADANGLLPNDTIVQLDGKPISSPRELQEQLSSLPARKRGVQIILMRNGGFLTVKLKKKPFRAKPFIAANNVKTQSTEECLRSPSVDCLGDQLLAFLKSGSDVSAYDMTSVARQFLRIGRPDLASELLNVATDSFLAQPRTLDGFDLMGLAYAHRAAGVPLPPGVLERATKMAKETLKLNYVIRALHIAGNTELAERVLQEALAAQQAKDERGKELSSYFYTNIASGYAVLGNMQSADAVTHEPRFSPGERVELDLAIAAALVRESRYEAVPKALDLQLATYRTASPSIDGNYFSEAAWLYWQTGNIAATEQIAQYLVARTKADAAADPAGRDDIDATVEVLGLLGRIPEALTLIEVSMADADAARKAKVDYRLISGALRRSAQNELDSRLGPVVDRALANWRIAYAEATEWPEKYERSISHLYQLRTRNGSDPPSAGEMEWQAGPSIDAKTRESLVSAIATGVLTGLNEARRMDVAPSWAMSTRTSLLADRRGSLPLTCTVMLMAADGNLDQALRFGAEVFGENPQLEVARDEASTIHWRSLVAARDFDTIARIYAAMTRPIQKMNLLVRVLIPIAGRCDTCTL
jgi:hypothetical protein